MGKLSHIGSDGRIRMVDIGEKPVQLRIAEAEGWIALNKATLKAIKEALVKKGDVLTTAEIAGITAAKNTAHLIPLCHPLITESIRVTSEITSRGVSVKAVVRCHGKTGAEMEALTAVSVALLTVYDMCKAMDSEMVIHDVHLIRKEKH